MIEIKEEQERAILVAVDTGAYDVDISLNELGELAETAGAVVLGKISQKRPAVDKATCVGSGMLEQIKSQAAALEANLLIFDHELTASQLRNIEDAVGLSVVDRTTLILDIFAQRAQSAEGKLQVELAQLKYRLPRLTGLGTTLSRLGGGIGTRGPGETQLEVDRRRIRKRIDDMQQELNGIKRQRDMRRARRGKQEQVVVALVGYTNAGKSTLLNALSGADVLVEDKLFATLDPVMRQIELPENRRCMLVDTVGFIRKLPHQLVEAFHSTLEEAVYADLILVVSDYSSPFYQQQRATVFSVLNELGASGKQVVEVLNKADQAPTPIFLEPADAVLISAKTGQGLDQLRQVISQRIARLRHQVELVIPYDKGAVLSLIHQKGQVEAEEYTETGTKVTCLLDAALYQRVLKQLGREV